MVEYVLERLRRRAAGVDVAALQSAWQGRHVQLLADADSLKVHPENVWHLCRAAIVRLAADLIEDRVDLQGVIAPDVLKAVGPGIRCRNGGLVRQRIAALDAGQAYGNGIDFR